MRSSLIYEHCCETCEGKIYFFTEWCGSSEASMPSCPECGDHADVIFTGVILTKEERQ